MRLMDLKPVIKNQLLRQYGIGRCSRKFQSFLLKRKFGVVFLRLDFFKTWFSFFCLFVGLNNRVQSWFSVFDSVWVFMCHICPFFPVRRRV